MVKKTLILCALLCLAAVCVCVLWPVHVDGVHHAKIDMRGTLYIDGAVIGYEEPGSLSMEWPAKGADGKLFSVWRQRTHHDSVVFEIDDETNVAALCRAMRLLAGMGVLEYRFSDPDESDIRLLHGFWKREALSEFEAGSRIRNLALTESHIYLKQKDFRDDFPPIWSIVQNTADCGYRAIGDLSELPVIERREEEPEHCFVQLLCDCDMPTKRLKTFVRLLRDLGHEKICITFSDPPEKWPAGK
ncbi:MAG: hypothetical protein J5727_10085 [Kiritimatiellae bacterium]|nr:hypothetical protein [Kiritimatiellia bacterium]